MARFLTAIQSWDGSRRSTQQVRRVMGRINRRNRTIRTPENVYRVRLDTLRSPNRSVRFSWDQRINGTSDLKTWASTSTCLCQKSVVSTRWGNITHRSCLNGSPSRKIPWKSHFAIWGHSVASRSPDLTTCDFSCGVTWNRISINTSHEPLMNWRTRSHEWREKFRDRRWPTRWTPFASASIPALRLKGATWLTLFSEPKFCYV